MGFFVTITEQENSSNGDFENLTAYFFAVGKKIGFSVEEMGKMTTQMFIDIVSAYVEGGEEGHNGARTATQADMDSFLM